MEEETPTAKQRRILINRARCNVCGDVISSSHRHDFVTCSCGALSVDGGTDYLRRCYQTRNYEELSEYEGEQNNAQGT